MNQHGAESKNPLTVGASNKTIVAVHFKTGTEIGSPSPFAVFLVAINTVGEVPHEIYSKDVLSLVEQILSETIVTHTGTYAGSEPLSDIAFDTKTRHGNKRNLGTICPVPNGVATYAYAPEHVVTKSIGLIRTFLLREGGNTDQNSGCNCKKLFHTFLLVN